jgi:hypothetical protein
MEKFQTDMHNLILAYTHACYDIRVFMYDMMVVSREKI